MLPKPVSTSRTTITELMIPSYANFGGKIHGGILLSLDYKAESTKLKAYSVKLTNTASLKSSRPITDYLITDYLFTTGQTSSLKMRTFSRENAAFSG
jgi:hypothetical protein